LDNLDHKETFFDHCIILKNELFKIFPWNYCKNRISIWAYFVPSNEEGVGWMNPKDTAFKFTTFPLTTYAPENIIKEIKNINVNTHDKKNTPAKDIWLNVVTKTRRAVCVILRSKEKGGRSLFLLEPEWINVNPIEAHDLLPFIAITHYPKLYLGDTPLDKSPPEYNNKDERCGAVFAHELGHIPGLADEYEDKYETRMYYPDEENLAPNIMADTNLRTSTGFIKISKIKWIDLIESSRRIWVDPNDPKTEDDSFIRKETEHPSITAGEDKYMPILEQATKSIIALSHPRDQNGIPNNPGIKYPEEPGTKLLLNLEELNVIEGGDHYWSRVYRPTPEQCLMRHEGYVETNSENIKIWVTYPYCRVCRKHMLKSLGGVYNFSLSGVRIFAGPPIVRELKLPSKVADLFYEYIQKKDKSGKIPLSDGTIQCIAATHGRYQNFFGKVIKSKNFLSGNYKVGTPPPPEKKWHNTKIKYPLHLERNINFLHWLWASVLVKQKKYSKHLLKYAAMGAVGTLLISGFGCLANRCETIKVTVGGKDKFIPIVIGLEYQELGNLTKGSILQIWPSSVHYEQMVRYVAGEFNASTCVNNINNLSGVTDPKYQAKLSDKGNPRVPGHSVIFMGKNNGKFLIADQYGINNDLTDGWRANFPFYIAAQWYDGYIPISREKK